MERLFDSLLDISRLDSGIVIAQPRPFALDRLFTQLQAEYADLAREKGLRLRVRRTNVVVFADEVLLHRLVSNLVANAIRYTESGSVMIAGRLRHSAVRLEVRDSGIGIPVDKQRDIFEEFYQLDNATRDRGLGLGLGLAIVARLAELLETHVGIRSRPSHGSVFFLDVPRAPPGTVAVSDDEATDLEAEGVASVAVLVLDVDPQVLAGARSLLAEQGCKVSAVGDVAAAEAALARMGPDPVLLLCDLWLPGGHSGLDVVRHLAAAESPPVSGILISGDTRPETIRAAKDAGLLLLHKPVSPAKLRAIVDNFAWRLRKRAESRR